MTATWGEYTIDFSIYGVEESHESEMTLTVTSNQLYSGGESQVSIEVNGDTTISACQFVLLYDASALQLVSCEAGELLKEDAPTINTSIPGMIYFSWDSLTAIQADGSLLDITFTTTADPEDMQTHLLIPSESPEYGFVFADENLNSISVEVIDGTIEIKNILYGDVNLDGTVNVVDANIIRRYAALLMELNDESLKSADVNGDGVVNIIDANLIRRYVAMLISEFPAER